MRASYLDAARVGKERSGPGRRGSEVLFGPLGDLTEEAASPIEGSCMVHDKAGRPLTKNAFDSAWPRLMVQSRAAGVEHFTFHDLKAKGVSDHKDHAGVSDRMKGVYVRNLREVEATE